MLWDLKDDSVLRAWYRNSSGGFILKTWEAWDLVMANRAFPDIPSSPILHRSAEIPEHGKPIPVLSIPHQLREVQAALSVNKSELARILRVSRPTIYEWLDGTEPNADNTARIQQLADLISEASVSAADPLFPRFVRFPVALGHPALLDLLCEDPITVATVRVELGEAKAMGDAINRERLIRETRLRDAGFESVDEETRKSNLALNMSLMDWPHE